MENDPFADEDESDKDLHPSTVVPPSNASNTALKSKTLDPPSPDTSVPPQGVPLEYTRIPLTDEERAMKNKRALADLVKSRYGPPDFPGDLYDYERPTPRKYNDTRSGTTRFRLLLDGKEAIESTSKFTAQMKALLKAEDKKKKNDELIKKQAAQQEVLKKLRDESARSKPSKKRKGDKSEKAKISKKIVPSVSYAMCSATLTAIYAD